MPRYRVGAYDKGSKVKGKYMVVDANSEADAIMKVKKFFEGVPLSRLFATLAGEHDKVDNTLHSFANPKPTKGAQ